ncbi:hypothetical protein KAR91_10920 [Candidatus Pacearchaeota archaeon]|nr:hypothetical protein [Candidatus Pacearchaeota archaeon]
MTRQEALDALGINNSIRVVTRIGIVYDVDREVVELSDLNDPYVYGSRVYRGGSFRRRIPEGSTRWFCLKNLTLLPKGEGNEIQST